MPALLITCKCKFFLPPPSKQWHGRPSDQPDSLAKHLWAVKKIIFGTITTSLQHQQLTWTMLELYFLEGKKQQQLTLCKDWGSGTNPESILMSRITMFVLLSIPLYLQVETFCSTSHCLVSGVSNILQIEQGFVWGLWKTACMNITYRDCKFNVKLGFWTLQTLPGLTSTERVVTSVGVGML